MISPAPPLFKPTSRKMCPAGPVYAGFVKPKPPNPDYLRVRRRLVATTRGAMLVGFAVGTTRTMVGFLAAVATLAVMLLLYFMKSLIQMMTASAVLSLVVFALFAVAIALFVQAMTRNKTVSIITGFVLVIVLGAFYSLNPSALSAAFSALLSGISVFARMDNAYFGILDLQAIVYFLSVAALFVFFTVQSIEKRRWS